MISDAPILEYVKLRRGKIEAGEELLVGQGLLLKWRFSASEKCNLQ
jgi:hypothetical protein